MSALATAGRRMRLWRPQLTLSRKRLRLLIAILTVVALAAVGGWFLLRDSSFVAIDQVTVTGVEGADAAAITATLDAAAHRMTTLDVQTARLRASVAAYPEVKGLRVSTRFPHGLVIHVTELLPVAVIHAPGREVVVGGDGTLLPHTPVTGSLPVITLPEPPIGNRLQEAWARGAATLLAAAPGRLLRRLAEAATVAGHGLVVQVRNGPSLYFGDATQAQAKWDAVLAVLADPSSAGASYLDVTDPGRPAAGTDAQVSLPPAGGTTASTGAAGTGAGTSAGTSAGTGAGTASGTSAGTTSGTSAGTTSGTSPGTTSGTSAGTASGTSTGG